MQQFHVRIAGDDLVFSAAHFITFGGKCERLHGHNYRVAAEVHGPLNENHYVVDFNALRDMLKKIIGQLDHHVLLPAEHASVRVEAEEQQVQVTFAGRRWVFPPDDCLLLPLANTTAELLARYIGRRLLEELESRGVERPNLVRIQLEEAPGQAAVCELRGD